MTDCNSSSEGYSQTPVAIPNECEASGGDFLGLPVTGAELVVYLIIALSLIALGLFLRRASRDD